MAAFDLLLDGYFYVLDLEHWVKNVRYPVLHCWSRVVVLRLDSLFFGPVVLFLGVGY